MSERHGNRIARFRLRPMWLKVHLWLGLWAGAVWVLMGLTGAVNVFRWDIDEWLNPELIVTEPGETRKSLDEILAAPARRIRSGTASGRWRCHATRRG